MIDTSKLTYLATPYTNYKYGRVQAFELACSSAAKFLLEGIPVYSPIAHSHPISLFMYDKFDHDRWMKFDALILEMCGAMIVVTVDGWKESRGVQHEIATFERIGKPIFYWTLYAPTVRSAP